MRGKRPEPDFHSLTLLLTHRELRTLDSLGSFLGVDRQFVLKRGLFLMDVAHTVQDAPADADIRVSVICPEHGAEMHRFPI
jgi:hypothetical protein